jgi:hypothetical protein
MAAAPHTSKNFIRYLPEFSWEEINKKKKHSKNTKLYECVGYSKWGHLKNKGPLTRPPIWRRSPHLSFTYSKTHGEGHNKVKHTRSQGVGRAGFLHGLTP